MMRRSLALLLPVAAAAAAAPAVQQPRTALVTIDTPSELYGNFAGFFANFSAGPTSPEATVAFVPANNTYGCNEYGPLPSFVLGKPAVAVVQNGTCGAGLKARYAREAGLKGILIASQVEAGAFFVDRYPEMDVLVVSVVKSIGDHIASWQEAHPQGPAVGVSLSVYKAPFILDVSELLLICFATSLVVAGAFCSTADLRLGSPLAASDERVVEVQPNFPLVFFFSGSAMLVFLYFTMKYLIYVIIGFFCIGGASCITEFGHLILRYYFPATQRHVVKHVPLVGPIEWAHVIAAAFAVTNVVCWFVLRNTENGWLFQDIMGASFLCMVQRTFRSTNMKITAALLCLAFFFDIFWVFISPLFFQQSVMVRVATGGGTGQVVPMLLRMPAIGDPLGRDRMVGFGDIALPGLLVAYLRRHDILSQRKWQSGFFMPAVVGYFVGLCTTVCALFIMHMGQPALLYLVPGTLGTTTVLAWRRGELKNLWEGTHSGNPLLGRAAMGVCNYCPGGHPLALAAAPAPAGRCDGCRKLVEVGERVMDCRRCNWYLCKECRVQEEAPATALVEQARDLPRLAAPGGSEP